MPAFAISALVGVIGGLWTPVFSSALSWPITLLLGGSLAWWFAGRWLLVAVVAFAWSSLHGHWYLENRLPEYLEGRDIVLEGVVANIPQVSESSTSFLFRVESDPLYPAFPKAIALRVYAREPSPEAGERWRLKVRLKRPFSSVNSGGLDYESWLLANRVQARGYVRQSALNRRLALSARGTAILRVRSYLRDLLETTLVQNPALPLVAGISIGVRDAIAPATWQTLRTTGTGHLVAISGLHIGMIALACWWPGRLLGWFMHCAGLVACPLVVARICVLLACCGYAALAGFSVPTLRATIMVAAVLLLATMQRQRAASGVLAAALLVILAIDPLAVLSAGFWLSFLAVTLLYTFLGTPAEHRDPHASWSAKMLFNCRFAICAAWRSQLLLCIGLALPALLFFAQVSLIAPVANLFAVPLFTFWILPATLSGLMLTAMHYGAGLTLLNCAAIGLNGLMVFLTRLAALPAATWQPGYVDGVFLGLLLCVVVVLLLPRPFPGRIGALAVFLFALAVDRAPDTPRIRLRALDVGQGLSVLVQTPTHNLLYDTGAVWPGGDAGESIILPELKAAGVRRLDVLMISHDDADHRGGAESILAAMPVGKLLASGEQQYSATAKFEKCRRGMKWQWDGVDFEILHPGGENGWSDNDASCVLIVRFADSVLLIPGDIEARAEFELLRHFDLHNVDLVIGPHHGSRTSSGAALVRELAASYVIFSAGYANRWGFPVRDVVKRWVDSEVCVLTTAASGALDFAAAEGGGFRLEMAARSSLARPWPLRSFTAAHCINTIKRADGTV